MDNGTMDYGINVDYLVTLVGQEHPDTLAGLSVIKWER